MMVQEINRRYAQLMMSREFGRKKKTKIEA